MTRRGFTLVETLVAIALFGVFAAAVAGLWASALRTSALASALADRARALEPHTVPAALAASPPPRCTDAVPDGRTPCLEALVRCEPTGGALRCEGRGPLLRIDLRIPAAPDAALAGSGPVRAWARAAP